MIRTQIQLTQAQARRVRAMAREHGVSMAEMIRRFIDGALEAHEPAREDLYARAAEMIGRFEDREGATDVSARHDEYLADVQE